MGLLGSASAFAGASQRTVRKDRGNGVRIHCMLLPLGSKPFPPPHPETPSSSSPFCSTYPAPSLQVLLEVASSRPLAQPLFVVVTPKWFLVVHAAHHPMALPNSETALLLEGQQSLSLD